tara:strand:- start:5325 stop:5996 length:672 start_codon:yes stop_codon:yes gene_type:complete
MANIRLPSKIIALKNPDKKFHEKWYDGRGKLNFPHPWRAVLLGPPNCGKGTVVKNLILRAKPEFEEIICIHCDPDFTDEWNDVDATMMASIPAPEEWDGEVKTLVILDDLEFKGMEKNQKRNLDRLFGFVSTHKNISVALCAQDPFNVPACVRRCANIWVLWQSPDIDSMATVARKSGVGSKAFRSIFDNLMETTHDSLWLDMTAKTPYPKRKNGFDIIKSKN